jgi:PAS domain S-box-containing protein
MEKVLNPVNWNPNIVGYGIAALSLLYVSFVFVLFPELQLWSTWALVAVLAVIVGIYVITVDRAKHRQLVEHQRMLRAAMANMHDVVIITDTRPSKEGGPRILFVSESVLHMTGYLPEELIGCSASPFCGPDTDPEAMSRLIAALDDRKPIKEVLINYRKDGKPFWNEVEIVPISADRQGGQEYFTAVQRDISHTKQRELELQLSQKKLRRLSRAQDGILEQERLRIARDLHDELGQSLTAMKLDLGMTIAEIPTLAKPQAQRLSGMLVRVDGIIDQVRDIAANLRPAMLDDLGFEAAAEWFLGRCTGRGELDVQWRAELNGRSRLSSEATTGLFRVLQECMTNINRHARARQVDVRYSEVTDQAILEVRDDGVGFDPGTADITGLGLLGMRERVAMLSGTLVVESALNAGTRIKVTLPLGRATND